jgi:hypothetical protein
LESMTHESATHDLLRVADRLLTDIHRWLVGNAASDEWRTTPKANGQEESDPQDQVRVVLASLARAHHLLQAVCLLTANGMAAQAQVIARALHETTINLRYVASSPLELASRYVQYEDVARYRAYMEASTEGLDPDLPSDLQGLESRYKGRTLPQRWDSNSIERRATIGDELFADGRSTYKTYKQMCIAAHGEAISIKDYVVQNKKGLQLRLGPSWHKAVWVLYHSVIDVLAIVQAAEKLGAPLIAAEFDYDLGVNRDALVELAARGWGTEARD